MLDLLAYIGFGVFLGLGFMISISGYIDAREDAHMATGGFGGIVLFWFGMLIMVMGGLGLWLS